MSGLRVALLGAGGQLGSTVRENWQAGQGDLLAFTRQELDITDEKSVTSQLDIASPRVIINCSAFTAVDAAEDEQAQAFNVNQAGTGNIARWARQNSARVIHVSTDFVFDGRASRPYRPDDEPAPLGVYGASKLAGERELTATLPNAVIVRTGWLYAGDGKNFLTTMLRLMAERDYLNVVSDQVGTPTATPGLASLLIKMAQQGGSGIYHFSDAGVASWYDFALAIQEEAIALGLLNRAVPINPIRSEEYPAKATRPAFSVLDKSRVYREFGVPVVHWREQLRNVLRQLAK